MKPVLIAGLGNTLMGDDGAGPRIAELLARNPAVTARADVAICGTDLLRYMDLMLGRSRVVLIDAADGEGAPGEISVVEDLSQPAGREHAHTLSAVRALDLMRCLVPSLARTRFTWVLVNVRSVRPGQSLSPEVAAAVKRVAQGFLLLLPSFPASGKSP